MAKNLFLDDLVVGQTWHGGPIEMREADIIRFAQEFDPQPMHVDKAEAASGRFGGIIASGWHVAAALMRDFVDKAPFGDTPLLGLKVDDLQWRKAVRPGDVLRVTREVLEIMPSRSRPDRGTISMRMTATNQDGDIVMSFLNLIQLPTRPAAGAS